MTGGAKRARARKRRRTSEWSRDEKRAARIAPEPVAGRWHRGAALEEDLISLAYPEAGGDGGGEEVQSSEATSGFTRVEARAAMYRGYCQAIDQTIRRYDKRMRCHACPEKHVAREEGRSTPAACATCPATMITVPDAGSPSRDFGSGHGPGNRCGAASSSLR